MLILPQGVCLGANTWRAVIVKSQNDYETDKLPGEGMQFPRSMVRSYSNPEYIYWAQDCGQGWRSRDGGETWERFLAKGLGTVYGKSIEVDPANPNTVFMIVDNGWDTAAVYFQGLYKSTDGGDNWGLVLPLTCDESDRYYKHNIAYALSSISGGEAKVWYTAFAGKNIYKSADGGDTWSQAVTLNSSNYTVTHVLYVHPEDSNTFYLGSNGGLYISADAGGTLNPLGDLPSGEVTTIQIDLNDPNIIYVAVKDKGAYKSTNAGVNFTAIKTAANTVGLSVNLGNTNVMYFLTKSDIYVSQDGGSSWNAIVSHPREGLGRETGWGSSMIPWDGIGAVIPNPNASGEAVGYAQAYLWKTTNGIDFYHADNHFGGYVWTCRNGMLFDPDNHNRFGLFGADKGLFISENAGQYYEFLETPYAILTNWGYSGNSNDMKAGAFQPGTSAFVAGTGGVWGSGTMGIVSSADDDGPWVATTIDGYNWNSNDPNRRGPYRHYFYRPDDPNILFTTDIKSTDGGKTFTHISYLVNNSLQIYGMSKSNPNVLYALNSTGNAIYRSIDGGENWSLYVSKASYAYPSGAVSSYDLVFDIDPVDCNKIYTLYSGDLASFNGTTWKPLGLLSYTRSLPENSQLVSLHPHSAYPGISTVIVDPNNNSIIYATVAHAGISGVYRSSDSGETWEDISYNLPRANYGPALSINPYSGEIFVGGASGTWVFPPPYNENTAIYANSTIIDNSVSVENLPPNVSEVPDSLTKSEGQTIDNAEIELATDPDGDTLNYTYSNLTDSLPYTISYDQAGTHTLHVAVSDGTTSTEKDITIIVTNANRPPVLDEIGDKSATENSPLSFSVNASDADSDEITYLAENLPSGALLDGQSFSWTPSYEQAGTYQITFIASDNQVQDSETITITVGNSNQAPVLEAIGDKSVAENSSLSFSVNASDADGDAITYSAEDLPSGASFDGQSFSWTPSYEQAGTYQVTFVASDNQVQDSETITITVSNSNRAPVLNAIGNKSVYANELLTFTVNATDIDGDTITYSAQNLPGEATLTNQIFAWTPDYNHVGSYDITFIASDGQLEDSEKITVTVNGIDTLAPIVTNCSPEANSIQIPLNHLIILHIVDAAKGVDANSVTITINENTVYTGNTADCNSEYGHCRRTGDKADYKFIYQSKTSFDFDQTMTIAVNAADLEGNVMSEYSYSFKTEMRAFGKNKQVSSASNDLSKGRPATVRDSSGNVWVAWHAGPTGSRDIYIGKLTAEAENFSSSIRLTTDALDQCNAAIAIDNSDKLYVAWQDNRRENWDIYTSTSIDGINWSAETRVVDSNDNEINPVIAVDGALPNKAYIVWQDDRESNQDIYTAVSSNGFVTKTISQITSDVTDQVEPAVAVDSDNTVYVVWTDVRGGSSDIYGAASNNLWTNVPIVNKANNQSSPAIAVESAGSILHLLWVDDTPGNKDIYYASSNGLPGAPLTGNSVIDDDSGADQLSPAVITTGTTGDDLKVFACWQDERNVVNSNADTDLYFVEASTGGKTNVLVGDDSTGSEQSVPAMRIDGDGQPYLVWADTRNTNADIYYAGSTFSEPNPLASEDISALSNTTTTVGTELESITSVDGVSIIVPAGAYFCDIKITISRVKNPPKIAMERFSLPYEFGPSGAEFAEPVTITIPYEATASSESTSAYWYNPLTATLSQEGITNVEDIVISPTLHALRFQTTHFTQFFIGGSGSGSSGGIFGIGGGSGGGGAGGCSVSQNCRGSLVEFLMPYIGLMAVMLIIKRRDTQNRKTRNT
jgi:hypothetical protein